MRSLRGLTLVGLAFAMLACAASHRQPGALRPAGHAWLIFIDDLHLDFRNTGRLRDVLRTITRELVRDGDAFAMRSSGPSLIDLDWTADRTVLEGQIRRVTGNGLKPSDIIVGDRMGHREVRYRAGMALAVVSELLNSARVLRGRRAKLIYISNGYDVDDPAFQRRLDTFTRVARDTHVRIFALDPQMGYGGADLDEQLDPVQWKTHLATTQASLRFLAERTGGYAVLDRQAGQSAVQQLAARAR